MIKTVTVIAANGRTGHEFVKAALVAGFYVRAGYHGTNNLPDSENLVAVKCDATKESDIRTLLQDSDAVVSLIGHVKNSPAHVQTDSMRVVAKVMSEMGIDRIISLTGTGVRFSGDTPSAIDRVLNLVIKQIDPARISDGIDHSEFLKSTNLRWTVIRVLKLTNGKHHGNVKFSLHGPAELLTPRARVAAGIVQLLENGEYINDAPIIQG